MNPLLAAVYANIRDFYDKIFWRRPGGTNEKGDGWVLNYTGNRLMSGANHLWIDRAEVFNAALLDHAIRFFRRFQAQWSILVVPEVHPSLMDKCTQNGCVEEWSHAIMSFEGKLTIPCYTDDVYIEPIRNNIQRYTASHILREAFHMEGDAAQYIFRAEHNDDQNIRHYLAYHLEHPGAVSTMTFTDGVAGIWNVGTRKVLRRKCLAHALMGRMTQEAQEHHYTRTMLIASNQGQPLYHKLGYQHVASLCYMGTVYF
jgi:GNAT superfamily N-acetyltransferase